MELILFSWISFIKSILDACGYSTVCISHTWLIGGIQMRLTDQFKQSRHSSLQISLKALNYRLFKSDFKLEDYLDVLNEKNNIYFL